MGPATAQASDLPQPVANAAAPSAFNWTGFYVGVYGGGAWGAQDSLVQPDLSNPGNTIDALSKGYAVQGGLAGVDLGYNFDAAPFLLGIEGDIAGTRISGSATDVFDDTSTIPDTIRTNTLSTDYNWLSTLRARLGVVNGPALLYVTGGLATASITDKLHYSDNFGGDNSLSSAFNAVGYTIGVGGEYALTENATVKLEYAYVNLGSSTFQTGDYWGNPTSQTTVSHVLNIVKAGLNWHF